METRRIVKEPRLTLNRGFLAFRLARTMNSKPVSVPAPFLTVAAEDGHRPDRESKAAAPDEART
jgi:hypothetical protein